ncbi:MAG: hypothetical protein IKO68_10930 [Oscillospiraceae bacterium]|nr:hypothetical protein [Oscillospiraceae bacterium]MBR4657047.1 hypothetical protein [Oscillospiraceae bacterium]
MNDFSLRDEHTKCDVSSQAQFTFFPCQYLSFPVQKGGFMPSDLYVHDLILRLKEIRQDQGLSAQNIFEMLDAAGCHVSLNSIKKVLADGSENERFRYHDTIQPIARVLLGIYGEDRGNPEIDALHADIRVKDELIFRREEELAFARAENARRSEFLLKQIALKDERIDRLMSRVDVLIGQLQKLIDRCNDCPNKHA